MKKFFSRFICFILTACIAVSGGLFQMRSSYTVDNVQNRISDNEEKEVEPKVDEETFGIFAKAFGIDGLKNGRFNFSNKYFTDKRVLAADADMKIVFFDNTGAGNAFVDQGSVLELDTSSFTLAVSRVYKVDNTDAPFASGTTMSFSLAGAGNSVIRIEPDSDLTDNSCVITRLGPGRANVNVAITENGTTRYATVTIHVAFEIVKNDLEWEETGLAGFSDKVLFLDQRNYLGATDYYQLQILYMDSTAVTADSVIVDTTDRQYKDTVVMYENGKLHVRGAGYSRVTLKTTGTNPDSVSFYVLVAPVGHKDPVGGGTVTLADYAQTYDLGTIYEDHFAIYTNARKANTLSWTVYVVDKNGGLTEISKNDHSRLTYDISDQNGVVNFSGVTAGTYKIVGVANTSFNDNELRNKVVYDVIVMLSLKNTTLYMNVGDTYDVLANSNIPRDLYSRLYEPNYLGNSRLYATVDSRGIITANNVGTSQITFHYIGGSNNSLFPPSVSGTVDDVTYTIHVIDYLSISNSALSSDGSTEFTMYAGGSYPLYAACTNKDYDIYWESLDNSIATVEDNGYGSVMVKALKRGVVTIRAYQIINGVEKNAYAEITVKNTATKVTLSPSKLQIEVGDYKTIIAQFTGDSTDLTWVSSDETIFNFVDNINVGTSATIQALKPGTAVLTAINPANIVCGYCEVTVYQEVTGLKLSEYTLTLPETAGTYQLYAYLEPGNASDSSVLWTSSKPSVVSVDANGKLTILKEGEATIIAQSVLNPEFYAMCTVKILQGVDSVKLDKHELELYKGEVFRLPYVILPADASNDVIDISVFDSKIASVTQGDDHTLIVTGRGVGKTEFMVMTKDGKYWDLCTVVVKQVATGVTMNYSEVTLNVGEYFDLSVSLTPADSTESSLTWQSLDTGIVSVSQSGRLIGLKPGKTSVMVSTQGGKNSFCTVTVLQAAKSMKLDETSIVIGIGESYTLDAVFDPDGTSVTDGKWTSLDTSIATVDEAGKVTGVKGGYTVVSFTSVDGGFTGFCMVKVEELITKIIVNPSSYILGLGNTVTIDAQITNGDTVSDTELEWYSDDESVATVDKYGMITGVDYGTATITVEAVEGEAKAFVKIEVVREVTKIELSESYITVIVGHTQTLYATVSPSNATYNKVNWKVMDPGMTKEDNSVALVDTDGVVTGIKKGNAWVVASAQDNSGKTARCFVLVIEPIAATGITVSDSEITLMPGESKTITSHIKPVSSTDDLTWTTNNDTVASVSENGEITANMVGQTTVTVTTTSGKTATIAVTVLGLSRSYVEIPIYSSFRVYLDGVNSTVRWDVDDLTICEVANGNITARKTGTTVVTAKVNGRTLECIVKVTK
jgi:uncharacterized protein YjdB